MGLTGVSTETSDHKHREQLQELTGRVLGVLSQAQGIRQALREVTGIIKQMLELDAVGVRLVEGEDYPYYDLSFLIALRDFS